MDITQFEQLVVSALEDVKAKDIQVINTTRLTSLFDRAIVASGDSNRQTRALARHVADKAREAGLVTHWGRKVLELRPPGMAGKAGAVEGLLSGTEIGTVQLVGPLLGPLANRQRVVEAGRLHRTFGTHGFGDLGAIVVHIMQPATRSYYNLEELWGAVPARPSRPGAIATHAA